VSTMGSGAKIEMYLDKIKRFADERLTPSQARLFEPFVVQYYARTSPEDLAERRVEDLYGAAMAHLSYARHRTAGAPAVRVYTPDVDRHGYSSPHSVVEVVNDDMPFLVDSLSMELTREGIGLHLSIHPVIRVRRDANGELLEIYPEVAGEEGAPESFIRFEVDRQTSDAALEEIRANLVRVLGDVRGAVEDWPAMCRQAGAIVASLDEDARPLAAEEREEAAALLEWLVDGHFVFLGYREYELVPDGGGDMLQSVEGSGLGILRESSRRPTSHSYSDLPPDVRRMARESNLLNLTKANSRSTVHRRNYLDYVGIKRFDEQGVVVAERRFLGLYTTGVYKQSPQDIPILRRTVSAVVERAGFAPDSHGGKALLEILDNYPRDELFQMSADELFDSAMAILGLQDRQRLRLLVRHDKFGRFVSCLVFLPRDRLTPALEQRIQQTLKGAFHGVHLEQTTAMTEGGVLVRLHLVIYTEPGSAPDYDAHELETQLAEAMRSWSEDLHDALVDEFGEERGMQLHRRYGGDAFGAGYMEDILPRAAVSDIRHMESLVGNGGFSVNLHRPIESDEGTLRLKLFRSGRPITLSDVLPLIENMGMQVADERLYEVWPQESDPIWLYDFGLRFTGELQLDSGGVRDRFHEAFREVWQGLVENDGFNRLVLRAGLRARDVGVVRAYAKYLRQTGTVLGEDFISTTLTNNPGLARLLIELFHARFDPDRGGAQEREPASSALIAEFERGLDAVVNLNEDRVLRRLLGTSLATVRTNFFQTQADGSPKPWLSLKLDSHQVPDLPLPRPLFETFVCSPRTEGIHLRGGRVARGGLRWSDRLEDYRTEVLGLMKAQTVKNAVIVPVGAKGGFVVKSSPPGDLDALAAEGVECYRTLVRGLLDITDNLVGGLVVPPPRVVRHDEDDPYLVVAADKGTATFSDIANALSADYSFWLGDAFASGGSSGYDHKEMAITARGAWVSVRRHLRELGIDVARDGLTAFGIGDMSGDVFGNGMLLEPNLSLVAAFDHRHIFLDPDPDPAVGFSERRRLFELARSSWANYDASLISKGGGVFPRTAKSIAISPEVQRALDIGAASLTPDDLIRAILRAPVGLFWNGGIGTYVKSSDATNAEVGDKTNDSVRVNGSELRCRVVGEGGNLGLTQLARVEFARLGGRIFTDAIDNSAGVDCSDYEVNIKILLDRVVSDGMMTPKQRDSLLAEMTDEVANHVLRDNEGQTRALTIAMSHAASMVSVHARFIAMLERSGRLNREIEYLPSSDEMRERMAAGTGLTAPELSVLLAYSKSAIYNELLGSDVPEDTFLHGELEDYFPAALRERFAAPMAVHPLRREIIATRLTNSVVNQAGITFVFRLAEETAMSTADIVRAHTAALEIFDIDTIWSQIDRIDEATPAAVQVGLFLEARTLAERASRWLLRQRSQPLDITTTVEYFAADIKLLAERLPELLSGNAATAFAETVQRLEAAFVPGALARRVAGLPVLLSGLDIVDIARAAGRSLEEAAAAYFALGDLLNLDWIRDRILELPRDDRWQALARAALRDDLYSVRAAITAEVLRTGSSGTDGARQVELWFAKIGAAGERCVSALEEIVAGGRADLTILSVALREIRELNHAGSAGVRVSAGDSGE
jgi:glutamate dehydrogenase